MFHRTPAITCMLRDSYIAAELHHAQGLLRFTPMGASNEALKPVTCFNDVKVSQVVKHFEPFGWCDADFWKVRICHTRKQCNERAVSPSDLHHLLNGTEVMRLTKARIACHMWDFIQIEFLAAHGVRLPESVPISVECCEARSRGIQRYQMNVLMTQKALQIIFYDNLAWLIVTFLSPENAWKVAIYGRCLCRLCMVNQS